MNHKGHGNMATLRTIGWEMSPDSYPGRGQGLFLNPAPGAPYVEDYLERKRIRGCKLTWFSVGSFNNRGYSCSCDSCVLKSGNVTEKNETKTDRENHKLDPFYKVNLRRMRCESERECEARYKPS